MRIAIANDMVMAVEALRRTIRQVPNYELVWVVVNGAEAVEAAARDTPDVILMDLMMPVMNGVEATRRIMEKSPCAILVVTSSVDANSDTVFQALGAGAVDAVSTPVFTQLDSREGQNKLLEKLVTVEKLIGTMKRPRRPPPRPAISSDRKVAGSKACLIGVGASAGGPQALSELLRALPSDFPPVVIVQHIDVLFVPGMIRWLAGQCPLPVQQAAAGDFPVSNNVYVASSNDHLVLTSNGAFGYTPHPRDTSYRPSINVFFNSLVMNWNGRIAAVLLTGMGRDGAVGLKTIKDGGGFTIAQDKDSCTVYGMPKAAAELEAAVKILPLPEITPALITYCSRSR